VALFELVNSYTYTPDEEVEGWEGVEKFQGEIKSYALDEDTAFDVGVMHFCLILTYMGIPHPRSAAFDIEIGEG
jgi:hypothetical protein